MSAAMAQVLSDDILGSEMVQKGLKRNALFSWEKCARETLNGVQQGSIVEATIVVLQDL